MGKRQKYKSDEKCMRKQGENQQGFDDKERKGKKKKKVKKKIGKDPQKDIKQEQQEEIHQKVKKKKSKKKKKQESQVKQEQRKNNQQYKQPQQQLQQRKDQQEEDQVDKSKLKKQKKKKKQRQKQLIDEDKMQAIDVESIKFQQEIQYSNKTSQSRIRKKQIVSFQDSQQIIYLFSLDAGDYKGLKNQLPHVGQRNIRNHLKLLFQYCLDKITQRVKENGRKIKQWESYQRRQIIRELHRIRSSNRLLSEANVELRQTFHKMMSTYNHPEIVMTDQQITFLYRKIEAFVRGFNQLHFFRKNQYVPPDQQDEKRKPIIEGGYIMEQKIMRQQKKAQQKLRPKIAKIDPQKLIQEWSQQQQKQLCKLYLHNINCEFIIENLRAKFGDSDKWKDFQILGKKIDHIIKLGLNRLQQLTVKPYNRIQKMEEDQRKEKRKEQCMKKLNLQKINKFGPSQIDDIKQVVYCNRQIRQNWQSRLIKNPSLLLKQVFAHQGQSERVKHALVKLLVQKYPQQYELQSILQIIKVFTQWAARQQQTNHVTLIRSREPVIDDGTKSKTMNLSQSDSQRSFDSLLKREYQNDQAEIAMGLTLLQDDDEQMQNDDELKQQIKSQNKMSLVYFGREKIDFDSNGNIVNQSKSVKQSSEKINKQGRIKILSVDDQPLRKTKKEEKVIEVYESEQSEYEGFISNPKTKKSK